MASDRVQGKLFADERIKRGAPGAHPSCRGCAPEVPLAASESIKRLHEDCPEGLQALTRCFIGMPVPPLQPGQARALPQRMARTCCLGGCFLAYLFDAVEIILLSLALPSVSGEMGLTAAEGGLLVIATLVGIGFSSLIGAISRIISVERKR